MFPDSQIILVHILLRNVDPCGSFDFVTLNRNVVVSLDPEIVAVLDSLTIEQPKCDFAHRHSGELEYQKLIDLTSPDLSRLPVNKGRLVPTRPFYPKPSFLDRLSDADGIV